MNITFDRNCIIDLEVCEGAVDDLRKLVVLHDQEQLTINIPGIGASERLKDRTFAQNFSVFQTRIHRLAKREFEILKPPLYLNISYIDWCIFSGEDNIKLEQHIHEILFPNYYFSWSEHAKVHGLDPNQAAEEELKEWINWRNRKCDTLAMWCHIFYKKDIFVTRDSNFHKATKKTALEKLGAKRILYPGEVI